MGRRRWRIVTIAAFLLFIIKDTQCKDQNDFYYSTVEKNFAQAHPPLFPNSRPTTFFDHGENYRLASTAQNPFFNEGSVRFPSPNYNQNPSPFQLPTGRSQAATPYYVTQPEFGVPQRQRLRPALPFNYQLVHPASTKRPEASQIHSVAYQNDPSKPETFLGQITINNPDIDYLQNSRFKNIPFDGNSLKSNGQSGHIPHDEDIDNDNQDLFDHHRVTTYNPNKFTKQRLNIRPSSPRLPHYDSIDEKPSFSEVPNTHYQTKDKNIKLYPSSTEYKELLDLEPLLEDDISDISSFRELMKNTKGSFDVQVIKSNNSDELNSAEDSKPDASSMNADNMAKKLYEKGSTSAPTPTTIKTTTTTAAIVDETSNLHDEEVEDDGEYVEYYDEPETSEIKHTTHEPVPSDHVSDIYDEYDNTEETEKISEENHSNVTEEFDVLVMKSNKTMVQDDNFKHFTDTTVIDQSDNGASNETIDPITQLSKEDYTSVETPSILGEVVSVVTTKSVVNGTISIPDVTFAPSTTKISTNFENESQNVKSEPENNASMPVTTENYVVVASVQTSRSVSGARFLPFPTVEQEEKKQVLTDDQEEDQETVTADPGLEASIINSSSSTENINDKLDSIQSELSSAVLSGSLDKENKNIELITESTTEQTTTSTTTTTTPSSLNVFTLKNTQAPTFTERSAPDPLPVSIKKFAPRVTSSTTQKPKKKLVTIMDELPSDFLPPGYRPRHSFKDKRTSTTSTTSTTTVAPSTEDSALNANQGRSSGISSKNKVVLLDDKSLQPKEYKIKDNKNKDDNRPKDSQESQYSKENKPIDDILKKFQADDLSKFLPPGYKAPEEESSESKKGEALNKPQKIDIKSFLPKGFMLSTSTTAKPKTNFKTPAKAIPVDISALLPPGFKPESEENTSESFIEKIKISDISSLLPPGFKLNTTEEIVPQSSTTKAPGGIKLIFPKAGGKSTRKTTPRPPMESGPIQVTPKILKGWPTRASTEFTGWPSPSTTPFSIEKLLEAQRNATATSPMPELSTEATTRRTTTTTTTTPKPTPSTTPGVCRKDCDIAATIKIIAGVKWVPELLDHHTDEWQNLAIDVKEELNSVYSKSDFLSKWYKGIRIDGFSQGSVLVDFFIELNDVEEKVDTLQLKRMFHKSLHEARPGSVIESVNVESSEFDPDVMLGDQPEEERMKKSNEKMTKTIDKSVGKLEIGKFVMDPAYTEFIVLPKREEITTVPPEEESFLPQWGIAVIVIAMASLLFVVIFGVTVLVNRQKSSKAKQPIPLSEDMLRELDKSHMGGYDDMHQMKERDLPYLPSGKRMSSAFIEQLAYPNPGDSWRSEWTPQLQKYMQAQHYTPDSGRGSQIYGQGGNAYGYGGGSQLYGQTGGSQIYGQTGGGSQVYGYTPEYPRSHYSRRRSEYDSNF